MADTREVLPVVTDDDYKELDPAPAVPSSQGTYPGGQLSPNPKMSPDIKEDGIRATEKEVVTEPGDQIVGPVNAGTVKRISKQEATKVVAEALSHLDVSDRIIVSNITALTNEQIAALKNGDIVCKQDSTGLHTYIVSFKKEGTGMCLTYVDANCVETVSYDLIGSNWTYNSTDVTQLGEEESLDVEISTDGGSTYTDPISHKEFLENCEAGNVYSVGTIARISNCINGATFRFILIGTNHDVLANTDLGELEPNGSKAKTTWQFYDMPVQKVNLGLQFDVQDFDSVANFLAGEDYYAYPSNKHGYSSATGLLDVLNCIYDSMPKWLKNAMKLIRKDCYIGRLYRSDDYGDSQDYSTADMIKYENDRYGSCVSQKLFCLSAAEVGCIDNVDYPITATINEGEDNEEDVNLEGTKYAYFEEGNESSALAKRIRYFGGGVWSYWLRTPLLSDSGGWGCVGGDGDIDLYNTYYDGGVAPAFCI